MQIIQTIQNRIFEIRGQKVMLDFDLALLYDVETKRINEQVKRNIERFPIDFMFRLTANEWDIIRSQIATGSENSSATSQIVVRPGNKTLKLNILEMQKKKSTGHKLRPVHKNIEEQRPMLLLNMELPCSQVY